jgi:hypothetical protein
VSSVALIMKAIGSLYLFPLSSDGVGQKLNSYFTSCGEQKGPSVVMAQSINPTAGGTDPTSSPTWTAVLTALEIAISVITKG